MTRRSGKGRGAGGQKHLRDIAYISPLSTIKAKDPVLQPCYQRRRERGKTFKVAMVPTIRKRVTILNAIARSGPAYA